MDTTKDLRNDPLAPLPFDAVVFNAGVVRPSDGNQHWWLTEAKALAWAHGQVGPNQLQVSVTAHGGTPRTFAIRHLCWAAGAATDTGWRCWVDGEFVGAGR